MGWQRQIYCGIRMLRAAEKLIGRAAQSYVHIQRVATVNLDRPPAVQLQSHQPRVRPRPLGGQLLVGALPSLQGTSPMQMVLGSGQAVVHLGDQLSSENDM